VEVEEAVEGSDPRLKILQTEKVHAKQPPKQTAKQKNPAAAVVASA
jgi:hypothetical protein